MRRDDHARLVRDLRHSFRVHKVFSALRALPVGDVARLGAGRVLCRMRREGMVRRDDHARLVRDLRLTLRVREVLSALRALPVGEIPRFRAGRGLFLVCREGMVRRDDHARLVRDLRHSFRVHKVFSALRALPVGDVARLGAGRVLCRVRRKAMSRRDNHARLVGDLGLSVRVREVLSALRALPVGDVARLGAGRVLCRVRRKAMSRRDNHARLVGDLGLSVRVREVLSALPTLPIGDIARLGTGRVLRRMRRKAMSRRDNHARLVRNLRLTLRVREVLSALRTLPVGDVARLGTGRVLFRMRRESMRLVLSAGREAEHTQGAEQDSQSRRKQTLFHTFPLFLKKTHSLLRGLRFFVFPHYA